MHSLNLFSSINKSFSLAMSAVKSNGKPKVSWSLNTTSPEIVLSVILEIVSSRISMPFSKVSKNLYSSFLIAWVISFSLGFNSGYAELINFIKSFTSRCIKGSLASILYPCLMPLLIILLKTYPLPSFSGTTPSAIKKTADLIWSAITLWEVLFLWPSIFSEARIKSLKTSVS